MAPQVQYVNVDGVNLAFQVFGDGPTDILMIDEWATPLEGRWKVPLIAGALNRLCSFARVITFDKRGIGLSDHGDPNSVASIEQWVGDAVAVADAVGAKKPVVFGSHEGGPIALLFAASLPERTESLVLVNTGPRLLKADDYPYGLDPAAWHPTIEGIADLWSSGADGEDQISATGHDPWWREWYAQSRRQQASPKDGLELMTLLGELDVRHLARTVNAQTLIIHRTGNTWWPIEGARWLGEQIDCSVVVEHDGTDNYWWAGDADRVVDDIEEFLIGRVATPRSNRELATIMFTDIVDSTAQLSSVGDRAWRSRLDLHDSITSDLVARHGGRIIKSLGDGHLIQFDGPAVAVQAATDLRAELGRAELSTRIAIHTGEVERRGKDLSGVAIHLASRMLSIAEPGTIVVSDVVRSLVTGSGIELLCHGSHQFKGITREQDFFVVAT